LFTVVGGLVLPVADFFAGAFGFAAVIGAFFTEGDLVFLGPATAVTVFFPVPFFTVAVAAVLAFFGALETITFDLALVCASGIFLEADFVFCFAIMSPLYSVKIRNPLDLLLIMILM
jgi:hypothetical protein